MQPGFCSSLLLACCRQRPDKKLFLYFILSSVAWKVVACIVAVVFLSFFVLKNPSCCHFGVPSSAGGFLSAGLQAHEWLLSQIHAGGDLSPSLLLSSFLCFDCDSACGKWNGLTWNDLRYRAWCKAKPGVKSWAGKKIEDGGWVSLFSVDTSWQ